MNGFSIHVPGRWSSHPKALKIQRRWFVFFALVPLMAVLALGVWVFIDFGGWQKLLHPATASFIGEIIWLKLTLGLVCATSAAYLTIIIMHGLAMIGSHDILSNDDDMPYPYWMIVLTGFSWAVPIAFYFFRKAFLPPGRFILLNVFLNLLCLLPVTAIIIWIKMHGAPKTETKRTLVKLRRPGLLMTTALCSAFALAACALAPDFPYRTMCMLCLATVAAASLCIKVLLALFKKRPAPNDKRSRADDANPPQWVERVRANLPAGVKLDGDLRKESVPNAAPLDTTEADPVLRLMMAGLTPTVDQSTFFKRFRNAREEAWRKLYEENRPMLATAGCDVLLTGMDGSGRTESLLAAALYAALVRGENVLYVVPSHDRAVALAKNVSRRVAAMLLGDYVHIGVLSHSKMKAMASGTDGHALPDVLFATPEQVERCFFGEERSAESDACETVKSIILAYATVLVDDFCEYPMELRVHLAFILDKWRLILANGFVLPQFVVALPPVYRPEGAQELGRRLFGVRGFSVDKDIVLLRPRVTDPYWFGVIRIDAKQDADTAIATIIQLCHAEGLKIVYYSKGMTKREKDIIRNDIAPNEKWPRLISNLDEMDKDDGEADAMLHLSLSSGGAAPAMRLRVGDTQAVFLRVVSDSEVETSSIAEPLVPLPDETALPLRVHHLKSMLRYLPLGVPVDAAIWSRFGITMASPTLRTGRLIENNSVPARWFYDSWTEENYPRVPPYLVLEQSAGDATPGTIIGTGALPAPSEVLWRINLGGGSMRLVLASPDDEDAASKSIVEWRVASYPVGESDMAHVESLQCVTNDNSFVFDEYEDIEAGDTRHAFAIKGKFPRGAGLDCVFPERTMSWNPMADANPIHYSEPARVGNVASFRLEDGQQSIVRVDCSISGHVNSFGRLDERESRPYAYMAYVSGVVLAPNFSPGDDEETMKKLGPLVNAGVSTRDQNYSPILTHAFTAALKRMFEGAAFFAEMPVFWCDGGTEAAGRAVVWFVEPVDSGRALFPLFKRMQGNPVFLKRFFSLVKECVDKSDSVDRMRAMSRFAVKGDATSMYDRSRAQQLVELLVAENEEVEKLETTRRRGGGLPPERKVADNYTIQEREFDRVVVNALLDFKQEIDVTKFAANYGWDHDRMSYMFFDVLWNNPQIFFVTKRASCRWTHCGDIVTRFVITDIQYAIAKEDYPARKAELDNAVVNALECVAGVDDPVEKARRLHDHIVRTCEYDTVAADTNDHSANARTAYSVLVRHLAVCEGYTMAYRLLLERAGLRTEEVVSDAMNHSWNYVLIGANWYHVDVTWDDPVYQGRKPSDDRISHKFFLLSDEAIRAKEHHDWDVRGLPPATDTTYDKRDWNVPRTEGGGNGGGAAEQNSRERSSGGLRTGVSWKEYKDHFLFQMKGRGNVKKCCGKVHLRVFFVDDGNSAWDDSSRTTYREIVNDISKRLEREGSASGAAIKVSWSTENRSISQSIQRDHVRQDALGKSKRSRKKEPDDWLYEALGVADAAAVATAQNDFKRGNGYDEAPIVFVFNKDFRSTARCSKSSSRHACGEWTMISLEDSLYENQDRVKKVLLHELLHLFGAEDLYYHPVVKEAAEKFLPNSVMSEGDSIDDLTRVLIGWDETLSANAVAFFNAIKDVSAKEFDNAHKKSMKEKWR